MYLEKLEIQGFKSFANKNVLVFPGMLDNTRRGLTAIVGPNGSGKSNVADSVRWVLGEQSMKTLRGKKSEDVIFSGSDKKGKLGMAEVSLYLNNEDGAAPIEYSQVVLSRRLYRSGESEYLLNNNKVRLMDVQMILAKAKFGQKTYSVIGQGTVEGFLNTSLSEKKEFFDEATGVKQFQIKRDDSLGKLKLSYENLQQAQMLLEEIEPRLKSLTRQITKLKRKEEIETELKDLQKKYYSRLWHELNDAHSRLSNEFLELEKIKQKKDKDILALEQDLNKLVQEDKSSQEFEDWQKELSELQKQKEVLTKQLAVYEAQMEVSLEKQGQFDLSWLMNKKSELTKEVASLENEIDGLKTELGSENSQLTALEAKKNQINDEVEAIEKELHSALENEQGGNYNETVQELNSIMKKLDAAYDEEDESKIKTIISEIKKEIKNILESLDRSKKADESETKQRNLISLAREKETVSFKIYEINLALSGSKERLNILEKSYALQKDELKRIEDKLDHSANGLSSEQNEGQQKKVKADIEELDKKISEIKDKISGFSRESETKRNRLFELQRKQHALQAEANEMGIKLNDLKVSSARFETKLEDLEAEIRESYGELKDIRDFKLSEEIDVDESRDKINNLKKQIEQIGGIDPETEKEYEQTKERFDFLSTQSEDLNKAIKSLEEIIKELDMTIKEKFDKEFKNITDKFEEYFKILFNGGTAKIIKVMESDLDNEKEEGAETDPKQEEQKEVDQNLKRIKYLQKHNATGLAGIEIQATPPGKKIKSIAMLSGGERALVAIALICAIISSNPSPFVVLDEVDAALDEANSERLAKILDDLSHKTQFIVITHNRASMRRANILYGVTMQDDGVSKLLSIKLEDAAGKISAV